MYMTTHYILTLPDPHHHHEVMAEELERYIALLQLCVVYSVLRSPGVDVVEIGSVDFVRLNLRHLLAFRQFAFSLQFALCIEVMICTACGIAYSILH